MEKKETVCKVAFVGSECYPFVKTGGLGDVMYALPRALIQEGCECRVILPLYACLKEDFKRQMNYIGSFMMDQTMEGRTFYVGIFELEIDGVTYNFIDNREFFDWGNPYTGLWEDIPKYCFFSKAALAILNYLDWIPDIIHCHDWQAALVPLYLRTKFWNCGLKKSKSMLTIHNLRFQGICGIDHLKYWSGLPDGLFDYPVLKQNEGESNMFKGGLAYADAITTVSATYAQEIQTPEFGEHLDAHLRYHSGRMRGIVNGIDTDIWDSSRDSLLTAPYDVSNVLEKKWENKQALREQLGLSMNDGGKMVFGLVSRLTDQKGLDLIDAAFQQIMDGNTQVIVLGTDDPHYENAFRYYEDRYKGDVCAYISYNESLAHRIYAGSDAFLVPSLFEPCGLTQLIAMRYGTVPVVRETGGLKDTVLPYNAETNEGNGFTFTNYTPENLLQAVNDAKTLFFTDRPRWDAMVQRNMRKDVSWEQSAKEYLAFYKDLMK